MKKDFAVNPDLISMQLLYLDRIQMEWIAMGMWIDIDSLNEPPKNESHPRFVSCSVFPLLFAFVSFLFQIDTNKSITQKRLKKVSESIAIMSF